MKRQSSVLKQILGSAVVTMPYTLASVSEIARHYLRLSKWFMDYWFPSQSNCRAFDWKTCSPEAYACRCHIAV